MPRAIYALFYEDPSQPGDKRYFYVGRSADMFRREKQHHYAKKQGHEDKYEFIRALEARGVSWHSELIRSIPDEEYPPDNERWFVIKLTRDGHELMNMRHGSAEHRRELAAQVHSQKIRSVIDVKIFRILRKYAASRALRRGILEKTLKRSGIPDVREDKLLPTVLRRRLLARHCTQIEAGVTLADIVRMERAQPMFRRIERRIKREA